MTRFDINAYFGHWPYWDIPHKSPDDLVALMDRNGIEQAACMSLRGIFADWHVGNEETLAAANQFPGRLIPIGTLSPFLGGNGAELRKLHERGMQSIRLYPSHHNYPTDHEFVDEICTAAAERKLPVMMPTRLMPSWRFQPIPIESIAAVVGRHPQTQFILSGPNYLLEYQAVVRIMKRCQNAAYEISCMQMFEGVAKLTREVGSDRILFGTGAVLNYPACNVAKLDHAQITDQQRQAIASKNALRLLGLA